MKFWLLGMSLWTASSLWAEESPASGFRSLLSGNLFAGRTWYLSADFEKNPDLEPLFHAGLKGGLPLIVGKKMAIRLGGAASLDRELNSAQIDGSLVGTLDARWIALGFGVEGSQELRIEKESPGLERTLWGLEGGVRISPWEVLSLCIEVRKLSFALPALSVFSAWTEFSPFSTGSLFVKGVLSDGLLSVSFGWDQRISFLSFRLEFQPDPMFVSAAVRIPIGALRMGYGMRVSPSLGIFHQASLEISRNTDRDSARGAKK